MRISIANRNERLGECGRLEPAGEPIFIDGPGDVNQPFDLGEETLLTIAIVSEIE